MNLTKTNWPGGWNPSEDAINGDPNSFLRMDNLVIDKLGVLGLVDGQKKIATLSDSVGAIFSRTINGIEYFWVGTGSGFVRYDQSWGAPVDLSTTPGAGPIGTQGLSAIGDAFGATLGNNGAFRVKDSGPSLGALPLGILTPADQNGNGPTGYVDPQQPATVLPATYFIIQGTPSTIPEPTGFAVAPDLSNSSDVIVAVPQFLLDSTSIGGFGAASNINNDIIQLPFSVDSPQQAIAQAYLSLLQTQLAAAELELQANPGSAYYTGLILNFQGLIATAQGAVNTLLLDLSNIVQVTMYFLLNGHPDDQQTWSDYYTYTWTGNPPFSPGSQSTTLTASRGDFTRVGTQQQLDWTKVISVAIDVTDDITSPICIFGPVSIIGGRTGQVNGTYNYAQVSVNNNGVYLAKSPISPLAINAQSQTGLDNNFTVINGSVTLFVLGNDPQANEYWFYRLASSPPFPFDPTTGLPTNESTVTGWQFVGKATGGAGQFVDTLSDEEVLQLNIDKSLQPNIFLQSLVFNDINGLQTTLYAMEGLYEGRMLYMDTTSVYLSDYLNPDAIDPRFTLKASGDATEINLWIKKLTNGVLILGTTKDLYEITGTLTVAPDGTIDAQIIAIGEAHPPISMDVCNDNGGLYYVSASGLRVTAGSNSLELSPMLRHLFITQIVDPNSPPAFGPSRHGLAPVATYIGTAQRYCIVASHQKLYFIVPMQDNSRHIIWYDTVTKTFGFRDNQNPTFLATGASGEVLVCYANILHLMDYKAGYGYDTAGFSFLLRTVFDANNQPRNRKDLFTLKLVLDTGGSSVGVSLQKDGVGVTESDEPNYISLGTVSATGLQTVYLPLNNPALTLGKRFSLQINDTAGVTTFKLYEYTIEYEPRPEQLDYMRILPTNLGTICRKRWTAFAIVIDTLGNPITFTPFLDNTAWLISSTVSTGTRLTYIFYFVTEAIATDIGGILQGGVFEFYGIALEECVSEKLPTPVVFLVIPANNYGTPNRKRHTSYKYQILTRGQSVTFTPIIDGVAYHTSVVNTITKRTVEHFFLQSEGDVTGIDIGGTLLSPGQTPFEFYGAITPQQVEVLPDRLEYLKILANNYGSPNRKRHTSYKFQINTNGQNVLFTPIVDGQVYAPTIFNTTIKKTVEHFFQIYEGDVIGIDIGGLLQSQAATPFEFYGTIVPQKIEELPDRLEYFVIPANNYGTPNRKRHTSYKYQINTNGSPVQFTPVVDGIPYTPSNVNTPSRKTVEHFFTQGEGDVIGIDVGGTLQSNFGAPFEFYGTVIPQQIEQLPDRLEYFRIPNNNFGIAAPKRLRTIPIVIDTYGQNVLFTPIVDGVNLPQTTILNSTGKKTLYHYFGTDVFGTDYGGILQSAGGGLLFPFEFYGFGQPEDVEILPVPKKFDQLGPMRFDKIGKLFAFRTRLIMNGATISMPYAIYGDTSINSPTNLIPLFSGSFPVNPGSDNVYDVFLPKSINTDVFRLVLGPTSDSFHRYNMLVKVISSGMQSEAKWQPIK